MSDETQSTVQTTVTTATQTAPAAPAANTEKRYSISTPAGPFQVLETVIKKGPHANLLTCTPLIDFTKSDPFAQIRALVGVENWNETIMAEIIRPAGRDAAHDVRDENNQFTDVGWLNAFKAQFLPASRKSGSGIKELRKKLDEKQAELQPFLMEIAAAHTKGEKVPDPTMLRYFNLLVEYKDISTKVQEKSRKGKKTEPVVKTV